MDAKDYDNKDYVAICTLHCCHNWLCAARIVHTTQSLSIVHVNCKQQRRITAVYSDASINVAIVASLSMLF